MGNLRTPKYVQELQTTLHAKAKERAELRFYALHNKIYPRSMLAYAYQCCRRNKGARVRDGQTFDDIESYGVKRWLGELAKHLKEGTYIPKPIRRVHIPKRNGKTRLLSLACLKDRVCQMAAMLVLELIFEADLPSEQYAYRRNRNAQSAVQEVHSLLTSGYRDIVDSDLSGYFDTIPHPELMKSVARRIVDGRVLRLIKQWLTAPEEEKMRYGKVHRATANRENRCEIPQGSPICPLLSNLSGDLLQGQQRQ